VVVVPVLVGAGTLASWVGGDGSTCVIGMRGSAMSRSRWMTPNSAAWSTAAPAINVVPSGWLAEVRAAARSCGVQPVLAGSDGRPWLRDVGEV
jgi:hypothetical protein